MKNLKFLFILLIISILHTSSFSQNKEKEPKTRLKILTWNIYMLPKWIGFTKKVSRAEEIGEILKKSDYDVIILQEAFMQQSRNIIRKKLKSIYPYIIDPPRINKLSLKANSGVWILSRLKLKQIRTTRFRFCKGFADCMANKGATLVEGEKNGKKFHLIGTHLQAEDKYKYTRTKQLKQIYQELIQPFAKKHVPMFISGDFNVEKSDTLSYKDMLQTLNAEDGNPEGEMQSTWRGMYNEAEKGNKKSILDYILIKRNGKKVKNVKRTVRLFRSKNKNYNLSDHAAVEMEIQF